MNQFPASASDRTEARYAARFTNVAKTFGRCAIPLSSPRLHDKSIGAGHAKFRSDAGAFLPAEYGFSAGRCSRSTDGNERAFRTAHHQVGKQFRGCASTG